LVLFEDNDVDKQSHNGHSYIYYLQLLYELYVILYPVINLLVAVLTIDMAAKASASEQQPSDSEREIFVERAKF
jgi:hypothetical protein